MPDKVVNVEMAAAWDGKEGAEWAAEWERHDRAIRGHHDALVAAAAFRTADRVLDIGCGNGETTRAAARAAIEGSALGVDLSSHMVERARELARTAGLTNISFERGDAQVYPFEPGTYDVALSRFGTMFFSDAVNAFSNIQRALRPGGRLVMVAWRQLADNEWLEFVRGALVADYDLPLPPTGGPGPFALADPDRTTAVLQAAGFDSVELTAVDAPYWLGDNAEHALEFFRHSAIVRGLGQGLDDEQRGRALVAMRATVADHETPEGVQLGSGSWLISARRPGP